MQEHACVQCALRRGVYMAYLRHRARMLHKLTHTHTVHVIFHMQGAWSNSQKHAHSHSRSLTLTLCT